MISIVLTTYNGEKYIEEQLDSIINQSYKNFEILIFDDCSTDGTLDILNMYEKNYSFVKVVKNKKRLGVIKNFEKGIFFAQGDFIALSDQDDIWEKDKLLIQYNAIKNFNIPAMVHSDLSIIDSEGKQLFDSFFKKKGYSFPGNKALDILISRSGVMGNTIMFNKQLKNIILPFFEKIPMHDYYIGVMNEIYGKRITIDIPLVKYRLHTNNIGNIKKNLFQKLKDFFFKDLPYNDRKEFLEFLLYKNDMSEYDKREIIKFLKIIEKPNFKSIFFTNYYKNKFIYRLKLFIRSFIK